MATALSNYPTRDRRPSSGLALIEPTTHEAVPTPRRLFHHLLVLEPTTIMTHECTRALRAANYAVRSVRSWHQITDWIEQGDLDAILLDLDAIDAAVSKLNISAARLITILRRAATAHPLAIAAVSRRDYVEVEEALNAGVDVFVNRKASLLCLIQRIEAVRGRLAHTYEMTHRELAS